MKDIFTTTGRKRKRKRKRKLEGLGLGGVVITAPS